VNNKPAAPNTPMQESPSDFKRFRTRFTALILIASGLGLALSLVIGAEGFTGPTADDTVLIQLIRLPRALGAWLTGALLGLSGALAQGLFRNPLADPYLLGSASGATLAVVLVFSAAFGMHLTVDLHAFALVLKIGLTGAAFLGAMGGVALTLLLARGARHATNLLLAGVVIGILLGALSNLITLLSPEALRNVQTFLYGSTSLLSWQSCAMESAVLGFALALSVRYSKVLDALVLGESTASSLGIEINRTRFYLILLMALATGCAVAETGLLAFVGLISPHVVRRAVDTTHAGILVLSALTGGALLLLADTLARWAWAPQELPVGLFTAVLGGTYLLWMIYAQERQELH
jgi:iron complex transport system permease protein